MNLHPWIQLFIDQLQQTTLWEWAAVILGITEVVLAKMNKIGLYPVGIASILISMYVLLGAHLYAESVLNVYYLVMSIYGWYYWIKKKNEPPVKISWTSRKEWVTVILIVLLGWAALYGFNFLPQLIHVKYTPSNVPLWDSWVAATAWAGMWLLAKRKIENWILLNISNLFAIPLLFYKQLAMFAVLTLVLFIVAIFGTLQWIRIWREENLKTMEETDMIPHPSTLITETDIAIIRDNAAEAEALGELHPAQLYLIERLKWFKLLVPKVYGGLETPLPDLIRLQEALSWADGSLGWTMTLCCGAGWFGGFIDPVLADQLFNTPRLCLAGSGAQTGEAEMVDDRYKISGTWKYATGAHHATHFTANCIIKKDGVVQQCDNGEPMIRSFVIPTKDVELLPAWKYIGMIATGSHSFNINGALVIADHAFRIDPAHSKIDGKLYQYPFLQLAEATLAVNLSGMALHFTELCPDIFKQKFDQPKQSDAHRVLVNQTLQDVTAQMNIAREELFAAVDASWQAPLDNNAKELKAVSLTSRALAAAARDAVDKLYPYCGLIAAAPDTEINRVWRDIHTAGQHSLLTFPDER